MAYSVIQSQISLLLCADLGNGLFNDTESDIITPLYILGNGLFIDTESDIITPLYIFREWIIQ